MHFWTPEEKSSGVLIFLLAIATPNDILSGTNKEVLLEKIFDFLMLFFVSVAMAGFAALIIVMFTIAAAVFIWKAIRDE